MRAQEFSSVQPSQVVKMGSKVGNLVTAVGNLFEVYIVNITVCRGDFNYERFLCYIEAYVASAGRPLSRSIPNGYRESG
jgi:hypothetical protein